MTVNELIAELNKIEDKDKKVFVYAEGENLNIRFIYQNATNYICFWLEHNEVEYEDFL